MRPRGFCAVVHKKWGPPLGNGSPNKRRQLRGKGGLTDGLNPFNAGLRFAFPLTACLTPTLMLF